MPRHDYQPRSVADVVLVRKKIQNHAIELGGMLPLCPMTTTIKNM
jgi:hypothetical protein